MVRAKNTKKRPAPTSLESKPKRRSTEKELPEKSTTEKKRSRPVTHAFPIIEESDSDLEEEEEGDWEDVEGEDDDAVMDDEPFSDDADTMNVDDEPTAARQAPKDPNGVSSLHFSRIINNQYTKLPENHIKLKKYFWNNAKQQSLTQLYFPMRRESGRLQGRKIFQVPNVRNTFKIS